MPRLTHQNRQSHYAQIGSLALGVTSARTPSPISPPVGPSVGRPIPQPLSMSLIRSSCSATHIRAPTSPTRRVPSVRVNPKSATGGSSADPSTACRAKGRCCSGSHTDWDAIRYRRPPTTRSNMFILSSSHILALLSTKRYICKVENPSPLELAAHNCESRASEIPRELSTLGVGLPDLVDGEGAWTRVDALAVVESLRGT